MSRRMWVLIDAPMMCALLCAEICVAESCSGPTRDTHGHLLCLLCSRLILRKHSKRSHKDGFKHHPRCPAAATAVVPAQPPKSESGALPRPQKRARTATEPGQPAHLTRLRIRVPGVETSPSPPPAKKAHSIPANVSWLLDQAHARRMAAAAAAASQPSAPSAPHDALVDEEKSQRAARTPAQWARRDYLQNIAPRCGNFPRTGRKGWNEKTGCHTDKDCNNNRWRTIDMFC